jgi:hypothetical protein
MTDDAHFISGTGSIKQVSEIYLFIFAFNTLIRYPIDRINTMIFTTVKIDDKHRHTNKIKY